MSSDTFADALAAQLRADAARPLVTFYDDATGERIELSVATYANWVAKTCGLVQDELGIERGGAVLLDLPTHWLGAVWLGATWSLGLTVATEPDADPDLVVCGPEKVDRYADRAAQRPVVALSLLPLGGRFTEPLPPGVIDYGAVVLGQPDSFLPLDPPQGDDSAWSGPDGTRSQRELLAEADNRTATGPGTRLLTDVGPSTLDGALTLLSAVVDGGSLVLVRNPDESRWQRRYDDERATAQLRA